jgi:hypothetical protein
MASMERAPRDCWVSSLNGAVSQGTFPGTYSVKADCTGTYQVEGGGFTTDAFFVIDDDGNELRIVITDAGNVINCVARKQFPELVTGLDCGAREAGSLRSGRSVRKQRGIPTGFRGSEECMRVRQGPVARLRRSGCVWQEKLNAFVAAFKRFKK